MNINSLVRPNILDLKPYSSARSEFKGVADVFLDANENPFETGLNRYPDPLQRRLKEEISKIKGIAAEHIFLGNGSDEAIDLLIRIFCEPGLDRIIILPPTYGMYKVSADISNVAVQEIPLKSDFQPDVDAILSQSDEHSKILFICSPNNPTGNAFKFDKINDLARDFPGIVVVDEAYIDFSTQNSALELLPQYPNLAIMQTFSKAWGLAGLRLGMAFAGKAIISLLNSVKPPYNINQLTQQAALKALQNYSQQESWVQSILQQRAILQQQLAALEYVERIYPTDANFLLVKVAKPNELYRYLIDRKIIVRNRSKAPLCEGCIRITVGRAEENQRLFAALAEYGC